MTPSSNTAWKISAAPSIKPTNFVTAKNVTILKGQHWLPLVMELHAAVRMEMPEAERHYLLPKPASYFQDLLSGKQGVLLGIMEDGELLGSMALIETENFAAAHATSRITHPDMDGKLAAAYGQGSVAIAQSMCVLGSCMGRGFSRALVGAASDWAAQQQKQHLFAQIADHNVISWLRFLQQDYAIVAAWENGHHRFLIRRILPLEKAMLAKRQHERHSYSKDYAQLPALLAEIHGKLASGHIALLEQAGADGALPFVFAKL